VLGDAAKRLQSIERKQRPASEASAGCPCLAGQAGLVPKLESEADDAVTVGKHSPQTVEESPLGHGYGDGGVFRSWESCVAYYDSTNCVHIRARQWKRSSAFVSFAASNSLILCGDGSGFAKLLRSAR